jgi:hypothetical protein
MKAKDEIAQLRSIIEKLEARIRDLEARPQFVPMPYPVYVPPQPMYVNPVVIPYLPPSYPWYTITCGGQAMSGGSLGDGSIQGSSLGMAS